MCDSEYGLVEAFRCHDQLRGSACGSSNPKWGRTGYLWGGHRVGLRFLFGSQGSTVYSAWMHGLFGICSGYTGWGSGIGL